MIHIILHFAVPLIFAHQFYSQKRAAAWMIMVSTMLIDLDHLLADPIYDPARCSIGFHPLHTIPAIVVYLGLFLLPLILKKPDNHQDLSVRSVLNLLGLGLLIHMALDYIDCIL